MAKTQNEHLKSKEKNQDNDFQKPEFSKPPVIQNQFESGVQLMHAVNSPMETTPQVIQTLQNRYGNNQVRRIIQPAKKEDPVVDQTGFLNKYVTNEIQRAKSGGQPLQADVSEQMKSKFGKSFDDVRLHADQRADAISRKIQAKAFTIGNDIFFRKGAYSPNSEDGRNTLMHELTHVVQQSSGSASNGPLKLGDPNDKFEQEAEGFAKSTQRQSQGVTSTTPDTVQRLSMAGIKTKIGGVFSRGGAQTNTTPPQGTNPPSQTTTTPAPAPKPGLNPADLASVQQAGVVDQADWDNIPPEKQKLILGLAKSDPPLAQMLVTAHKASQWPKDESGAEITEITKLEIIIATLKVSFADWATLDAPYKKLLIDLKDNAHIQELILAAKSKKWPKDGSDQDISDSNSINAIKSTLNISLDKWQDISDKNKRGFLLKNRAQPYALKLGELALAGNWPKDGSDQDILNENHFVLISVNWNIGLDKWLSITEKEKRGFLLQNSTKPYAQQLLNLALSGKWPKDGSDQDIKDANSFDIMTKKWNVTLDQWNSIIDKDRRKFLLENGTKPYAVDLAAVAHMNKWPQDVTDVDIKDDTKLITITKTLKIPINQWLNITDPRKRKCLLDNGTKPYAIQLAGMVFQGNWPKDGSDTLVFDDGNLTKITNSLKISLANWLSITKERRGFLLDNSSQTTYIGELVKLALQNSWPKGDSDQDILDDAKLKTITETLKISLAKWLSITDRDTRKFLLDKSGESYIGELVILALQGNWPIDKNRAPIKDDGTFKKIKDKLQLSLSNWTKISSNERRGYLLEFGLDDAHLAELGTAAVSGIWPLDGGDRDISTAGDWKKIKEAYPQMSPSYWNGLGAQIRNQALSQTSTAEIQKAINNAKFRRDKKENAMDKIGEVTGHGATDTVLSSVGLAGSITSLSKGTGDNETLDRAGAATSAAADAGNFLASGGSLLGSISQLRRGSKMSDKNSSRASKQYGEKEKSRGRWGISQSVFGMASSGSSFSGNVIKANDPSGDTADKASSGLGVAGGFFGMVGSALGLGKGSASMHSARKRSSAAKGFIKAAPTSGALTNDEVKMNAIAQFTAKHQNKTGKGFGIFKSVTSFIGSALGTTGSIGSLAGMSKEGGFGLGIAGAALSGLGILGGIGQMIAEKKNKPSDSELNTQATNLIGLLRSSDANTSKKAAEFVVNVLKINLINLGDTNSYTSWIDEDEAAATALIKSKLSKL